MNVARVSDKHVGVCDHGQLCCPHNVTGTITSGSADVFTNGVAQARDGDVVTHNCPHCGTGAISCTSSVYVNGKPIAHLGDKVIYPGGSGVITTASQDVNADD